MKKTLMTMSLRRYCGSLNKPPKYENQKQADIDMLSGTVKRKQNENRWIEVKLLRYMALAFSGAFAYIYLTRNQNNSLQKDQPQQQQK